MNGLNASLFYDAVIYVFSKLTLYTFLWFYSLVINSFNSYNINNFSSYIVITIARKGSLSILLPSFHVHVKSQFI